MATGKNSSPQRDLSVNQELGVPNLLPTSTWYDFNGIGASSSSPAGTFGISKDPLAPSQEELVFMLRRDGQARAMLNLLTLPIRAAFARSEWVSPTTGGGDQETAFANLMWSLPPTAGGMEVPASMFLRQALLALPYGFSAFEVVRRVPDYGPLAGMLTIEKLGYRDPRTVTFLTDDHGNYVGFRQITNFASRQINVVINKEDSWYWAANEEENPLYGVSLFEPAFQHYQMKRKMYFIGNLAAQMAAVPGRIGKLPLGATPRQINDFKSGLANFAFNTSMIAPYGFEVTPFNNNTNFNFIEIIDHHNMMMASSILAKFLQQEDRQVLIDNGKADASADMYVQMLEAITAELSESWTTKLMPPFIDANFGTGIYPVHRFAPLTDENKQAILALFQTLAPQSVLNCTPEFVRVTEMKLADRLGYDIDYQKVAEEEQRVAEEQAAQAAALQEQQAQQQQGQPQPQGKNLDGTPATGGQPGPVNVPGLQPSNKRTPPGGNPVSAGPIVKASSEQQKAAFVQLVGVLDTLYGLEEVPADFAVEDEVVPEIEIP